ncbi:MAG: type IV pilin protein [Lysobacteraceae bacterium]
MTCFRNTNPRAATTRPAGQHGFTIIELMIVVAILAILTAIAVPAYNDQVRKARRADGKAVGMEMVQALERFHTANNTYVGFGGTPINSPATGTAFYVVTAGSLTATAYTVTMTPQGGQTADTCGTMTITSTGARTPSTAGCW